MPEPSKNVLVVLATMLLIAVAALCTSAYYLGLAAGDEACRVRTATQAATIATLQRENDSLATYVALMICVDPGAHPRLHRC